MCFFFFYFVDRSLPEMANPAVLGERRRKGFPRRLGLLHEPRPRPQQVICIFGPHTTADDLHTPTMGTLLFYPKQVICLL